MTDVPVPAAVRDGGRWERIEAVDEEHDENALVTVHVRRVLFGDRELRDCVADATGEDRGWRTFFASRLTTDPELSGRIAGLVVRTIALPRAKDRLVDDLESRGFEAIRERGGREIAVGGGEQARLVEYGTAIPTDEGDRVQGAALLAVWEHDAEILVAGGIYPVGPRHGAEDCFEGGDAYRRELVDLIRAVGGT